MSKLILKLCMMFLVTVTVALSLLLITIWIISIVDFHMISIIHMILKNWIAVITTTFIFLFLYVHFVKDKYVPFVLKDTFSIKFKEKLPRSPTLKNSIASPVYSNTDWDTDWQERYIF